MSAMNPTIRLTGVLDPRDGWEATGCSIARALEVVGTRSALLLLREAFYGTTRFDDFAARVGLSDAVTAARLRELTDQGLLERVPYREPGQRTRHGYRLTEQGADLLPVLIDLMAWGDRWRNDGGRVELRHRDCGGHVHTHLECSEGHTVARDELELARRATEPSTISPREARER
jgi:DNA-binding HxlR family transcriptional regulator